MRLPCRTFRSPPTAINITYQVNQAGDLLILSGVGVLPAGKPAIKEDYTYATLLQKKLEDQVMKKLPKILRRLPCRYIVPLLSERKRV
jgi:hypothetical protein